MQKTRVRRVGALLVGLSLVAAACGGDDDDATDATDAPAPATEAPAPATEAPGTEAPATEAPATEAPTSEAPTSEAPTTEAPTSEAPTSEAPPAGNGELEGFKGTTPMAASVADWYPGLNEFWQELGNDPLSDFNYGPEAYDAVVVIALAAIAANDDGSAHAAEIVNVTKDGEKCTTFADCAALLEAGSDIDYDGVSGPLDFNGNGEPLAGSYGVLQFGADNRLLPEPIDVIPAELPESAIVDITPVTVERAGDGVLKIGALLPETGGLAFLGPPEFAGVQMAIRDINEAGGVLGADVEYTGGDSGATGDGVAPATTTRLLSEDVDAIIGAASSGVTLSVIDTIVQAGVTMFSPANTAAELSTYDDKGLYFRDAPSDVMQAAVLGSIVAADGFASAYVLNLDDAYGNGFAAELVASLEASGVTVLGQKAYDPNAATFDAEVGEIVSADPDAVILIGFAESSKILRTAVEQGVGPTAKQWYGTDGQTGNALGEDFDAGA